MTNQRSVPLLPFALSGAIIIIDQAAKAIVAAKIPDGTVAFSAFGDFFWLVRQHNLGMAFSLFDNLTPVSRTGLLIALPLLLIAALVIYYFKSSELGSFQRWLLCGIAGGGIGNIIDRIFRPEGVVDFLSFKFYGIFGYERWPTFNIADASVVVCSILLAASTIAVDLRTRKGK